MQRALGPVRVKFINYQVQFFLVNQTLIIASLILSVYEVLLFQQAPKLAEKFCVCHLATGKLLLSTFYYPL